ncbi:MAG: cytochrome c [Verrucomicrobia bacterium]|nr:cytochrome c [Verrucomicrobiota bacterium]
MRYAYFTLAFLVVLTVSVLGFRGSTFTRPPMMVFPDTFFPEMNHQAKYKPQASSTFFADGRADRPLPAGVVSRNPLRDDDHLYRGKTANGQWAKGFPAAVAVDARLIARGRERYTIYCAPCHGALGDGKGIVTQYNWGAPANFHSDVFRSMPEGQIFDTITNGAKTMFSYGDKLVPEDRWAVIAYVRALQRAQNARVNDVEANHKQELGIK